MTDAARHTPDARPPGPKGHPIYGSLSRYHDDPIAFLEDNAATYGDVSAFRFFHLPVWQLHHPDDVQRVLVDPDGAFTKGVAMEGFRPLIPRACWSPKARTTGGRSADGAGVSQNGPRRVRRGDGLRQPRRGRVLDRGSDGGHGRGTNRLALGVAARTLFGAGSATRRSKTWPMQCRALCEW